MLRPQGLRHPLQFRKMCRRVTIPKGVIRNGFQPLTQQGVKGGKFWIHSDLSINKAAARRGFG